jgi:hypothetical protein
MGYWLSQFPYHVNLNAIPFIIDGLVAIMLTIITVGSFPENIH